MDIDPGCTFSSLTITAKNQHVMATLRDALSGVYPWPVLVRASDQHVATELLHAAANHVRGDLARTLRIERTSSMGFRSPVVRSADAENSLHWFAKTDVLIVDGIDARPITTETIIVLARVMEAMHAEKRPVVTIAALSNDVADGHLVQLTTRYAGGRPLTWQSSPVRKTREARKEQRAE